MPCAARMRDYRYLENEFAKMDRMRADALARGIRTLRVTYEDLVRDKGAGLERVAKFVAAGTGCDAAGFTYTGEEASWRVGPRPRFDGVARRPTSASTQARRPPAPHVVLRRGLGGRRYYIEGDALRALPGNGRLISPVSKNNIKS